MRTAPFLYILVLIAFFTNTIGSLPFAQAQEFRLPAPGVMVHLSPEFNPPILKGIKVHPDNPFRFDFILDKGDSSPSLVQRGGQGELKQEASRLIKYFLASLTIPENDLWVNLSPYEKDRIIPQSFGMTEMGRDLLAEDYMLKQITASLIYPEGEVGKKFWKKIYEEASKKFGTTNIPVNTFNKVWIVPEKAVVYENAKAQTAYVVESKLKVMLEQDYLSLEKHASVTHVIPAKAGIHDKNDINALGSQIVRDIVIPELTREVNENKNFAQLRQVYNSLILATWYKKKIKDSILAQVYADKNKTAGVQYTSTVIPATAGPQTGHSQELGIHNKTNPKMDPRFRGDDIEEIYQRYLQAFKKGVFNYIKEEEILATGLPSKEQGIFPRKYFSGGVLLDLSRTTTNLKSDFAMNIVDNFVHNPNTDPSINEVVVRANLAMLSGGISRGIADSSRLEPADHRLIRLRSLPGEMVQSWSSARWFEFKRRSGKREMRQSILENLGESLMYHFEIYSAQDVGVGEVYAAVNDNKKEINIKLIQIDPGYWNKGYASAALNLLKTRFLKDGYGDYLIRAMFNKVNPKAEYSRRAFENIFGKPIKVVRIRTFNEVTFSLKDRLPKDPAMNALARAIGDLYIKNPEFVVAGVSVPQVVEQLGENNIEKVRGMLNGSSDFVSFTISGNGPMEGERFIIQSQAIVDQMFASGQFLLPSPNDMGPWADALLKLFETPVNYTLTPALQRLPSIGYLYLNDDAFHDFQSTTVSVRRMLGQYMQLMKISKTASISPQAVPYRRNLIEIVIRQMRRMISDLKKLEGQDYEFLTKRIKNINDEQEVKDEFRTFKKELKLAIDHLDSVNKIYSKVLGITQDRAMASRVDKSLRRGSLGKIDLTKSIDWNAATLIQRMKKEGLNGDEIKIKLIKYNLYVLHQATPDFTSIDKGIETFLRGKGRDIASKPELDNYVINTAIVMINIQTDPKLQKKVFGRKIKPDKQGKKAKWKKSDRAMMNGGIDLTPANMKVQVKTGSSSTPPLAGSSEGIKFHLNLFGRNYTNSKQLGLLLQQLQNAPGFVPVIVSVKPLGDLDSFLGIVNQT